MTSCDFSFDRPDPHALKAAGIDEVIRYATGAGKGISRDEFNSYIDAGLAVSLVQEGGNQPALGGYNAGRVDAYNANAAADAVGYSRDSWLWYVLEDPNRLPIAAWQNLLALPAAQREALISWQWAAVEAYMRGVQSIGGRTAGAYGGLLLLEFVLELGLAVGEWPVRSWGGVSARSHMVQEWGLPPNLAQFANQIDVDTVLIADHGQHPRPTTGDEVTPADITTITAAVVAALPKPVPPDPGAVSDAVMLALRAELAGPGHELFDRVTQAVITAIKQTPEPPETAAG